jgi:chaperone LolA
MRTLRNPDFPRCLSRPLAAWALGGCLLLGTFVNGWAVGPAADTPLQQFVRELESSYHGVETLRAEFSQTYEGSGRTRVESGTVYFARGGLMRWDYREPTEKLFLANRQNIILYIPEEKQVTRTPVKASEDYRVPFRLLLTRLDLRKIFRKIEFADGALKAERGDRVLRGFPRGDQDAYEQVLIEVTPTFDIRRLVVFYADHTRMEFVFSHIARNLVLNPRLFQFVPPPGSEVIEQR